MLQDLSPQQIEQALTYLHQDVLLYPPPQELKHLNEMEWFLLDRMLESLLKEKEDSPLQ
jgi:hypothetical protein